MNRDPWLPRLLRVVAVGIAIAAAFDPAITSKRLATPEVAVFASTPRRDSALTERVIRALGPGFIVTRAPLASADASIVVGDALPLHRDDAATPTLVVTSSGSDHPVAIESVRAPATASLHGPASVVLSVRVTGSRGRTLEATLRNGDLVVDRAERAITADTGVVTMMLNFVPASIGPATLQVTAGIKNGQKSDPASVDLAVDVTERKWSVLFYDPRASWMSTFVRRATESDDRFVVTSRVVTSKNISTDAGSPPPLDNSAAAARFDAIVVGAPDALTDRDVAGLDAFMRRRGGNVILLLDQAPAGPVQRLIGTAQWRTSDNRVISIGSDRVAGDAQLKASSLVWPVRLADDAESVATTVPARNDSAAAIPAIWRIPVGPGRLTVSGALDAWRYRDSVVSGFDHFSRALVADAANGSQPAIAVSLSHNVVEPDEPIDVSLTMRDVALQALPAQATVAAELQDSAGTRVTTVRLWPDGPIGDFGGRVRAPLKAGQYRLAASGGGHTTAVPLVVARSVSRPAPDQRSLLLAWARSRGGGVISSDQLGSLPAALRRAIHATPRPTRWHPMHSLWWLLPFALALSGEWWLRRRRGLP